MTNSHCEWRCVWPVTTAHYNVQARSLVILVIRETQPSATTAD